MKEVKFFCDRCKKEVRYLNYYTFPGYKKEIITLCGKPVAHMVETDIEVEICDECMEKIRKEFNFHQN